VYSEFTAESFSVIALSLAKLGFHENFRFDCTATQLGKSLRERGWKDGDRSGRLNGDRPQEEKKANFILIVLLVEGIKIGPRFFLW
jgi:hypothetical protein